MKRNKSYSILCSMLLVTAIFSSCKKESESTFDIFKGLKINFTEALAQNEVYLEFKLKMNNGTMSKAVVKEVGSTTPAYTVNIPYSSRAEYLSGVLILKASNPQTVAYNITVLDMDGKDITSSVTITYPAGKQVISEAKLITDKKTETFEEGEMVYLDYSVSSDNQNIKYIWLESFADGSSEPARTTIATLPDDISDKRNFRGAIRLNLNRDGGSKFRIYVTNEANDYIGDGYTSVNTNVKTGYELMANKFVYIPNVVNVGDSGVGNLPFTAKCFYSISRKQAYTYDEAKAISEDIDFGVYFTANTSTGETYINFYSMLDATNGNAVISNYDLTSWTKRDIKFSTVLDGGIFTTTLVSGLAINTEAKKYAIFTNRKRVSSVVPGKLFYFKTPEGKSGAILVNSIGRDFNKKYYVNIDIKIVK